MMYVTSDILSYWLNVYQYRTGCQTLHILLIITLLYKYSPSVGVRK